MESVTINKKERSLNISIILAIASGCCHVAAYVDYYRAARAGKSKPNGATWAIWSVIALISVTSYFTATDDIWKNAIPLTNIVLVLIIFALAVVNGEMKRLTATDWCSLAIGIIAIGIWKATTASYANLVVQAAIVIGFIPTYRMVWNDPSKEAARPWLIWGAGYFLAAIVVILRWHQWLDLVYPINCLILHPLVPILGRISRSRKRALAIA